MPDVDNWVRTATDHSGSEHGLESLRLKLRAGELGTLPFVIQNLLQMLSNPNSSAKQLGQVVAADQALSAAVLRLANSAYYGFSQKVSDVRQAVTLVGYGSLRELVMSITSYDLIFKHGGMVFDRQELWNHGLAVACTARVLARRTRLIPGEVVFVAGILHEVGFTLIDQHAHNLFVKIVTHARKLGQSMVTIERDLVGVTHAEVGMWAAQAWNLPPVLQSAIRYHHEPFKAGEHVLPAAIVAAADLLCRDPYTIEREQVEQLRVLSDYLKLTRNDQVAVMQAAQDEVKNVSSFLGVATGAK
ncbi:MAG: HDOD domain-containing protein [Proteobacteria bacterium]|nr:HDOD domain-containing protein [Pseudomonadota bacterium]